MQTQLSKIRNFSIIAHIDHGKSTLADRMLEITGTVEKRKMKDQVLDSMELERERGITIKMQPVRMNFKSGTGKTNSINSTGVDGGEYVLNLIDTPGHIDFYYEVSRALKAVEGCILLVDSTQGVQAQTLATLGMAREAGLTIIPVISKIDSPLARISEVEKEVAKTLDCRPEEILRCSGRTGEGVRELLEAVIERIPPPKQEFSQGLRALIFDFQYSNHRGVIVYVRVMDGTFRKNDRLIFKVAGQSFVSLENGIFSPDEKPVESLSAGEIGYIVTGIKQPGIASVGDTISSEKNSLPALPGYMTPKPVVWASIYPESQDNFDMLRQALGRLRLSDSSFTYEEETSGTMGRGFRTGFLGMLHLEIITERLRREFSLELVVTTPSINYEVTDKKGNTKMYYSPSLFPEYGDIAKIREPWVELSIITPPDYINNIMPILYDHEAIIGNSENFGDNRMTMHAEIPLRELMRGFFDKIKSASSGFASISYNIGETRDADVAKLDLLVADEIVPAFTRIVSKRRVEFEAENAVEKLFNVLPRQMFAMKIQGKALGRIISSRTVSALKKDVTGHLYGGDITRKRKLWEQQKEGKKRLKAEGRVNIPQEVFVKMMRQGE